MATGRAEGHGVVSQGRDQSDPGVVRDGTDPDAAREAISDNYQGAFDSTADWAEQFLEDTGGLSQIPENLRGYFDFEAYARDAELSGDIFDIEVDHQHHVFWSH